MRVLVTGATGIVGANLVRALLAARYQVRALVREASDVRALRGLEVERCTGDVLDGRGLPAAVKGCKLVFHAAASFSYSTGPKAQRELALRGTRNVLEAAQYARVSRCVLTSSSVVLGSRSEPLVLDETATFADDEPSQYTLSKVAQEAEAFDHGQRLGMDVVSVCPTLAVGPFDFRLSPSNASIVNYLNDPFRSTFLGGCNIVSAHDVARGHILAAERGSRGQRYVLGSENLVWSDVHALISKLAGTFGPSIKLNHTATYLAATAAEAAARIAGMRPSVTRDEARMSARYYWYSHARIASLGYAPRGARAALSVALAWVLQRGYVYDAVAERLRPMREVNAARQRLETAEHL